MKKRKINEKAMKDFPFKRRGKKSARWSSNKNQIEK